MPMLRTRLTKMNFLKKREGDQVHDHVNELEHYGVLGMKWGVRRYQPYPSGKKKGIYLGDGVWHQPLKYKTRAGQEVKEYAKFAINQTIAMLVPGYALLYNVNVIRNSVKYNMDGTDYSKKDGVYEKVKDLTKKSAPMTAAQDAKVVNPGNASGRVNNCGFCTAAMEMRRRGYDVKARRKATGISTGDYDNWFENVKHETAQVERQPKQSRKSWVNASYDNLCQNLEKKGNGARGYVAFNYEKQRSGHTLFWEVQNGSVTFYDGQSGKVNPGDVFSFSDQNYLYARLDKCKLKPAVTETCISRDYKKKQKEAASK